MVLLEVTITRELELQRVGSRWERVDDYQGQGADKGRRGDEKYNFLFFPAHHIPLGPVMILRRGRLAREPREVSSDIAFKAQKSKRPAKKT